MLGYGNSPWLYLQGSGEKFQALFGCANQEGKYVTLAPQLLIPAGQWTHLAGVIAADGTVTLYVNGKAADSKPLGGKIKYYSWYPAISVGNYGKMGNLYAGDLTRLRWWARAATAEEIAAAAAQKPG